MKRLFITTWLVLATLMAAAQTNVLIKGSSTGAAGKHAELYTYADMLSMAEVQADEATIASDGSFELRCYANYPRLVFIQIENYSQSFYVEPGRTYEVYLPPFDWTIDEQRNIHLMPEPLPLEFLNLPPDELNLSIGLYEHLRDSFIVANRVYFDPKFHPQRRYFDSLRADLAHRMPTPKAESFLSRYMDYTLAEMQYTMHFASRKQLAARYIADQPVRYYDEQYMRFFLALFGGSIAQGTARVPMHRLVSWVESVDLPRYLDSLGTDPLLRNEQVRELAALQALKESYYLPAYDRTRVRQMVEELGRQTKFADHSRLAQTLVQTFRSHESGTEMPTFTLPDADRNSVSLEQMRGKWVYISFVRVGDPSSQSELETMAHFHDSICNRNPDVCFVTVCCDREFQKMYHLLRDSRRGKRYNWTWLHFDGNYKLLQRYGVVSYPTFVLIAPDGRLQYELTPAPATGFLLHGPWEKKKEQHIDDGLPFWQR